MRVGITIYDDQNKKEQPPKILELSRIGHCLIIKSSHVFEIQETETLAIRIIDNPDYVEPKESKRG